MFVGENLLVIDGMLTFVILMYYDDDEFTKL